MSSCPYKQKIDEIGFCIVTPTGNSMLPLIEEGKDTVKIVPVTVPLKKYDVILYRRPNGKYVLHRIVKITKKGYVLCGDNQVGLEKYVKDGWVIGVMEGYYKGENYFESRNAAHLKYAKRRVRTRLFRRIKHIVKKIFKGNI